MTLTLVITDLNRKTIPHFIPPKHEYTLSSKFSFLSSLYYYTRIQSSLKQYANSPFLLHKTKVLSTPLALKNSSAFSSEDAISTSSAKSNPTSRRNNNSGRIFWAIILIYLILLKIVFSGLYFWLKCYNFLIWKNYTLPKGPVRGWQHDGAFYCADFFIVKFSGFCRGKTRAFWVEAWKQQSLRVDYK